MGELGRSGKLSDYVEQYSLAQRGFKNALVDLLNERDFSKISISDITKRSGYSRSSFYYHYEDIFDFVNQIGNHEVNIFGQLLSDLSNTRGASVRNQLLSPLALNVIDYVYGERRLYKLILDSKFPNMTLDDFIDKLVDRQLKENDFSESPFNSSLDMHLYLYVEMYECMIFFKYWSNTDFTLSPKEFAGRLATHLTERAHYFDFFLTDSKGNPRETSSLDNGNEAGSPGTRDSADKEPGRLPENAGGTGLGSLPWSSGS